jgi:hypothetical protein
MLALADAALAGKPVPTDFTVRWHNDFLKAQQGTFVPFTVTVESSPAPPVSALLYVRAVPRAAGHREGRDRRAVPAVDAIVPVQGEGDESGRVRFVRGFTVPAGDYDVCVVVRERLDEANPSTRLRAGALVLPVSVPDFWTGELTTSSVMLARRLDVLAAAPDADDLSARPYAIGRNEITPAVDGRFASSEELIVVLLVYDAAVTRQRRFDVDVEYHFFRRSGSGASDGPPPEGDRPPALPGETYFNHTEPQRFTPESMGRQFDPRQPVMAGQGIPLAGFPQGVYRLAVAVTDRVSGRRIQRDVAFTVEAPR